jgi:hypothetical protein
VDATNPAAPKPTPGPIPPPPAPKGKPRVKKVSTGFFTPRALVITSVAAIALGAVALYYRPSFFASLRARFFEWIQDLRKRFRI